MPDSEYEEIFEGVRKKLDNPKTLYTLSSQIEAFEALASDVEPIDECLSGGLPRGRIIEVFGPEASGKTTVTLHFIAAAQRRGDVVCFIDAEHALDPAYASRIGVNFDKLMFSQPDNGEQALEIVRVICEMATEVQQKRQKKVNILVIIDSIPGLIPAQMWETYQKEGFESSNALGAQARMMAEKIPMITNVASKSGVTVVFINQERDKIGVVYGSPISTPGGRTVKFFASLRMRITRIGYYKKGGETAGIRVKLTPVKSKLFPIFGRIAEFIIGPNGIDRVAATLEAAIKHKVITKGGSWYHFGGAKWQGLEKLDAAMRDGDSDLFGNVTHALRGQGGPLHTGDPLQLVPTTLEQGTPMPEMKPSTTLTPIKNLSK